MKKKGMISFIILFSIFFGPMVVEAKTECQYVLDREDFIPVTFVLETEDDDSKLTKVTLFADTSVDMGDPKFANGEGLDLNDDGTCPNIVVYDQRVMGGYKIYKTMNSCHDGWLTSNNNCFELSGTVRDSSSSESDQTGAGVQFRLTDSTDSSCSYERVYDMYNNNQRVDTITINSGNNNSLTSTFNISAILYKTGIGGCTLLAAYKLTVLKLLPNRRAKSVWLILLTDNNSFILFIGISY